jgi:hypothetical protein
VLPPGVNGTTSRIGLVGKDWADAQVDTSDAPIMAAIRKLFVVVLCMVLSFSI